MFSRDVLKTLFKKKGDEKGPTKENLATSLLAISVPTHHGATTKPAFATFEPNEMLRLFDE